MEVVPKGIGYVSVEMERWQKQKKDGHIRLAFTSAFAPRRRTTTFVGGHYERMRAFTRVFFLATRTRGT